MCQEESNKNSSSSFLFGIILGAVIGAVIAIYFYRQDRQKVMDQFKKWFENLFAPPKENSSSPKNKQPLVAKKTPPPPTPAKRPVVIPKNVDSLDLNPSPPKKPAKMFKK